MTEIEDDVAALKDYVEQLLEIIFQGQAAVRGLERALVERHGLSVEFLRECQAEEEAKTDALRQTAGTAIQKLKRF